MKEKILIITGGGDCPGLNAVIRAVVLRAEKENWEVFGSINAFNGLLKNEPELLKLTSKNVKGIHALGGTIIGTTNKGMPSQFPVKQEDGSYITIDRTDELIERFKKLGFTALINIGGDGSQGISYDLYKRGLRVVGVPKTIDNDLAFTDFTFGFQTAVHTATDAVDKLITTAASHQRVMILEVMGRDAGWIALNAGLAGGAQFILIPEIPFNIEYISNRLKEILQDEKAFAIIVVAEGAVEKGKDQVAKNSETVGYKNKHLGGIGEYLKSSLEDKVDRDIRVSVLGHLQRGGSPIPFDRIIATEFGVKAVELIAEEKFGVMTSYKYPYVLSVPLEDAIRENKFVSPDSYLVKSARGVGISFGDVKKNSSV